jgi:ubiquinone/menaquinone biosynthesis C-methylase UbiE
MPQKISHRLLEFVNALPLKEGLRILEIGCGTGVAAREIAKRIENGKVLAIDRSAKAIEQAIKLSQQEINSGSIQFLQVKIEELKLSEDESPYDFAFAVRVGALDGRHPELEQRAIKKIKAILKAGGKIYIDGGSPLKEINLVWKPHNL